MDVNCAGHVPSRRSKSGYYFSLESAMIHWLGKKQPTVVLFSIEAEYCGDALAAYAKNLS